MTMKRNLILYSILLLLFLSCKSEEIMPKADTSISIELVGTPDTSSVVLKFIPSASVENWMYALTENGDIEDFENETMAEINRVVGSDSCEMVFENLKPSVMYTVFAKGLDVNGYSSGVAIYRIFTADNGFKAEIQYVTDNSAGFEIKFDRNYYSCRYYLGTADDKENFLKGTLEGSTIIEMNNYRCINYFDLEPEKEYVFYCIAYDRYGIPSTLEELEVVTYAENECPNVEVMVDLNVYQGKYQIVPNDKCGKVIACVTDEGLSFSGELDDLIYLYSTYADLGYWGTVFSLDGKPFFIENTTPEMMSGKVRDLVVVIFDKSNNPVGVKYFQYKTPEFNQSIGLPVVEVAVHDITSKGATYSYSGDNNTFGFFYETVEADWYDDFKETSEWSEYYMHNRLYNGGKYTLFNLGKELEWTERTGNPNFRYYACACPVNANGPVEGGWGPISLTEYTTIGE